MNSRVVLVVLGAVSLWAPKVVFAESHVTITSSTGDQQDYASITDGFAHLESGDTLRVYGRHVVKPDAGGGSDGPLVAPLLLINKTNVVISGAPNAQIYGEGTGDFLDVENCQGLRFENLAFAGNHPPAGAGGFSMIMLRGTNTDVTVSRCRFSDYGDHAFAHLWSPKLSRQVLVTDCAFENGGSINVPPLGPDGSAVGGIGSDWTVQNCTVTGCVRGFEIENAGTNLIENVRLLNNTLVGMRDLGVLLFVTNGDGDKFQHIDISGNTFKDFVDTAGSASAMRLDGGRYLRIHANTVTHMTKYGIVVMTDSVVSDVDVSANSVSYVGNNGIILIGSTAPFNTASVSDNNVQYCGEAGIRVSDVSDASIAGNICYNNALYTVAGGIEIVGGKSDRALLRGNKCYDNQAQKLQDYGILVGPGVSQALVHDNYCLNSQAVLAGIKDLGTQTDLGGNKTTQTTSSANGTALVTAVLINAPPSASISLQPDGHVLLVWPTAASVNYAVEFKNSLADPSWTQSNQSITTSGTTASLIDPLPVNGTRYYRIRVLSSVDL